VRLFVAAWPSPAVREVLRGLVGTEVVGLRATPEERWHVTLRFLGEVDGAETVTEAVRAAVAGLEPTTASLGPATVHLGGVFALPVAGLDELAASVTDATAHLGVPPERRPFQGHVTIARARGRQALPDPVGIEAVAATSSWTVTEVAVVRSHLGEGHRYETLASLPLSPG